MAKNCPLKQKRSLLPLKKVRYARNTKVKSDYGKISSKAAAAARRRRSSRHQDIKTSGHQDIKTSRVEDTKTRQGGQVLCLLAWMDLARMDLAWMLCLDWIENSVQDS